MTETKYNLSKVENGVPIKASTLLDLCDPNHAYLFGFIQADGHLRRGTRNRGSLVIELGARDRFILEKFVGLIPVYSSITLRQRKTNFKEAYQSVLWRVCNLEFRQHLLALGVPEGRKSMVVAPPLGASSACDYYRGWIDADGALGLTANEFPFLTFTTSSEAIARSYLNFIEGAVGKQKTTSRNTRDKVFNIALYKEDAQLLAAKIYYDGCLALPRKLAKAREVAAWARPARMKKIKNRKNWSEQEDEFVMTHSISESMQMLERSAKSIVIRRWRLRNRQAATSISRS